MITLSALDAPGIRHAYFTRAGGVSTGVYASLNCGFRSGDAPANIAANRARAVGRLGFAPDALAVARQVHGRAVAVVDSPWKPEAAPDADALVTRVPGIVLGVLTADCVPLLFVDPIHRIVAVAHAGWRGAIAGIVEATIAAMTEIGAETNAIIAGIGPCIGAASYEVGDTLRDSFLADDAEARRFFAPGDRGGHHFFDLGGLVAYRLGALGVGEIARLDADTVAAPDRFFSYRRSCLDGEAGFGLGLSAIALAGPG